MAPLESKTDNSESLAAISLIGRQGSGTPQIISINPDLLKGHPLCSKQVIEEVTGLPRNALK